MTPKQIEKWLRAIESNAIGESEEALRLSRYEWLSVEQAKACAFPPYFCLSLMPFAKGHDGSWIGWLNEELVSEADSPILVCPRDEEYATLICHDLGDAIFWLLAEELQDCWLEKDDCATSVWHLDRILPQLIKCLTHKQIEFLTRVAKEGPYSYSHGSTCFLSPAVRQEMIQEFEYLTAAHPKIRQYSPLP